MEGKAFRFAEGIHANSEIPKTVALHLEGGMGVETQASTAARWTIALW